MKLIALIFTLFLSLFSGGKDLCTGGLPPEGSSCAVFESTSKDNLPECSFNKDICLASAQTFSFEGSDTCLLEKKAKPDGKWDGHAICDIDAGGLVILIRRGEEEIIPKGDTVVHAGDILVIVKI